MKLPRIMLAGTKSGGGKTTVTCGILTAFIRRGLKPASFKCGPDYIDPMFHSRVIGAKTGNLDTFFTSDAITRYLFAVGSRDCDLSVIEGVMGFYDGVAGISTKAGAYDLSCVTDTPVLLIVDCKGMSLSIAAEVKGFLDFKNDHRIAGVILNRISPMLYPRIRKAVEDETGVRVFGYVPEIKDIHIESRHLGLVMPDEVQDLREELTKLAVVLEQSLDIDDILALAQSAPDFSYEEHPEKLQEAFGYCAESHPRIAIAKDEAFCFLYRENLELLQQMGAELVWFSPLHDSRLPENTDGILLPGGYPELYAKELSENTSMKEAIRNAIQSGMPCIAECGGFMYLHNHMEDLQNVSYEMTGIINGNVVHTNSLKRFGYIELTANENTKVFSEDADYKIPAHEFHYFDSDDCGTGFHAAKPMSNRGWDCIHSTENLFAGYPHLYYYGQPGVAQAFLKQCEKYKLKEHNSNDESSGTFVGIHS